ncbi:hypothetical protein [Enterococcus mediterraneensis]|uniref:hypothetical protein n=1 Tax=Enterococcus mediterraneensis TaxID=2364791 RepID=UPI000F052262|nr:hypothetical protein [Enterococcus mediterraneensis]
MDIKDEIKKLSIKKKMYFEMLFPDVRKTDQPITMDHFCNFIRTKNIDYYKNWEKTEEFQRLKALRYASIANNDFFEIYDSVSEKAKNGDEKSIKLFLTLSKELKSMTKQKITVEDSSDDGLML